MCLNRPMIRILSWKGALEKRLLVEDELKVAREKVTEADNKMRQLDKVRHEADQSAQAIRSRLERAKMEWQECKNSPKYAGRVFGR